jgi:hypothetical protein
MKIGRRGATLKIRKEDEMRDIAKAKEEEEMKQKNSEDAWNDMSNWGNEPETKVKDVKNEESNKALYDVASGQKAEESLPPIDVAAPPNAAPFLATRRASITVGTRRASITVGPQKRGSVILPSGNSPTSGILALALLSKTVGDPNTGTPAGLVAIEKGGRSGSVALSGKGAGVGVVFGVLEEDEEEDE